MMGANVRLIGAWLCLKAFHLALYVAFWLQLGGASSAAVTLAILALPTRGSALAKAVNRIAATLIGATTSVVTAGLFSRRINAAMTATLPGVARLKFC